MKILLKEKYSQFLSTNWLLGISAFFLFCLSTILTLSPSARFRTWDVTYRWVHWIGYFIWLSSTIFIYLNLNKNFKNWESLVFFSAQTMAGWGLINVWRINPYFGFRQTVWLILASIISILLIRNPLIIYRLKKYKYFWLAAALLLLMLTFFFGTYPGGIGPKLWLGFKGLYFQPSEFLKIILIIFLASYFSEKPIGKLDYFRTLLPTLILVAASVVLLIAQKDLGTALIFLAIYILMVYFIYGKKRILLIGGILLLLFSVIGYFFISLIRIRFLDWILPWGNSLSSSYQIIQSIISIASGGFFGTGVGLGYPNFVPLAHSDFIFSSIAEETGLVGSIGFISLIFIFLFQGIKISLDAESTFFRYLSAGVLIYVIAQSILILGGNVRLLPITGVTLPFVSYGGSSLITSYFSLSLLLVISGQNKHKVGLNTYYQPFKITISIFAFFLIAIALTLGWWGFIRENDLQNRSDNPRHLISNLYVKRGDILDRNNEVLATTKGEVGSFSRSYPYPQLSNSLGYIHQRYGLFALEEEFDGYLSGMQGYPASTVWLNYLLYDQPPGGRAIRLTIDLKLQRQVDNLFINKRGAAVVLDAQTGNILAISTTPSFDANQLNEKWSQWNSDENAPFLNRASQGAYPLGGILSPLFLFKKDLEMVNINYEKTPESISLQDTQCLPKFSTTEDFYASLRLGCLSAAYPIITDDAFSSYSGTKYYDFILNPPTIGLPINSQLIISETEALSNLLSGDDQIRSSPLQIAASFAPLSNGGFAITPSIVSSVNISTGQWIVIPSEDPEKLISENRLKEITQILDSDVLPAWEISAVTFDQENKFTWYVLGTNENWTKTPLIIALVLENGNRYSTLSLGREIFAAVN